MTVFGLSADSVETQKEFQTKHDLSYDLIADPGGKVLSRLGVPVRLGKFASRQAYLFKNGKLVWKDEKGTTATQGEDVLRAIAAVELAVDELTR